MRLHIPRIDMIAVADAGQRKFDGEHIKNMWIGKGQFDGSIHTGVQCVDNTLLDKMIPVQTFANVIQ